MTSVLIRDGTIIPCDADMRQTIQRGFVATREDRIELIGAGDPPERILSKASEIIDATGHAVIPGLVNAHTHLFQCFLRGLADDKPLLEWLKTATWPGGLAMTEDDFYLSGLLGFVENLKCGATSVLSQDYVQTSPRNMDAVMQAAQISGVRARLARGCGDCAPYFDKFLEPLDVIVAETRRLIEKSDARVRVEFGPMITWGCTADALKTMDRLAREWNVGVHIHINETRAEVQMSLDATGMRQINWLDWLGVLNERWQLVHCVWLDESEIQIVAERGCTVVHCPVSNMYLASGIAPIVEYRRRRIPVALASDGPGSNNSQDMLEVLKTTANLQKVGTLDAMSLLPEDVLEMCYRGGATALGLGDQVGRLAPGALADLVLVDLERAHIAPVHSPQSALVYNANGNDVDTVVVNGEVVVRGGELVKLSEKGLVRDCQRAAEAMARRAGIRR